MRFLIPLFMLLSACSRQPLATRAVNQVGAVSVLGNEFVLPSSKFNDSTWKVDAAFREALKAGVTERGKEYRALEPSPAELERALGVRESRWKKVVGKESQAVLDLLFRTADRDGIRYFFLVSPIEAHERYPLQKGTLGAACNEEGRAYVYFYFRFTLWDVAARRKAFEYDVNPSVTSALTFGDCAALGSLSDPGTQLEDPVKKTMSLLVDALFDKMGWKRAGQ
ncbi:MAG: hypothetical protein ACXWR1_17055 [Bdellovibrionota bacterium]